MPTTTPELKPARDVRTELVRLMRATLADRRNWTYRAVRPLSVPPFWRPGQHVVADCSKAVQYLCRWSGAPDPMGNQWGEWGNSTTLAVRLQHLPNPGQLLAGDVVTFGPAGTKHAAMVLEPAFDPLLWSFGHQGAPNTYRLSEDRRVKQYLRLPVPPTPVPDVTALRRRTDWFAWAAWRLGEGDWAIYGPMNAGVRPNVPRMISPAWWARWVLFIAARKKPNEATT
jgi:hypothetical protein